MVGEYLKEISKEYPFSGNEQGAAEIVKRYMSKHAKELDCSNSPYATFLQGPGNGKRIAIISYLDESGFLVREHFEHGFLGIEQFGNVDKRALTSQEVYLFGEKPYFGVIGNKPSHYLTEEDRKSLVDVSKLFVDTGILDEEELKKEIPIGSFVGLKGEFKVLHNSTYASHGLSLKVGSGAVLECAALLKEDDSCDKYFLFTSNTAEGRGRIIRQLQKYEIEQVILIVGTKTKRCEEQTERVELGKGPVVLFGGSVDYGFTKRMYSIGKNKWDRLQTSFFNFDDNNLLEYIFPAGGGYPGVCIGIPVENMGMSFEICKHSDITNTAQLIADFVKSR